MRIERRDELAETRLDYWNELTRHMQRRNRSIVFNEPRPRHQLRAKADTLGSGDFILVALATIKPLRIGVGVEISVPEYYAALEKDEARIRSELRHACGEKKLDWNPETKVRDIWLYRSVNFFERMQWPEQHEWLCDKLEAFQKVLKPRIEMLLRASS